MFPLNATIDKLFLLAVLESGLGVHLPIHITKGLSWSHKPINAEDVNECVFGQISLPGDDCGGQAVWAVCLTEHLPLLRPDS